MVRYLLDVVKMDVNGPDQPADFQILPDHQGEYGAPGTPTRYIPSSSTLE